MLMLNPPVSELKRLEVVSNVDIKVGFTERGENSRSAGGPGGDP